MDQMKTGAATGVKLVEVPEVRKTVREVLQGYLADDLVDRIVGEVMQRLANEPESQSTNLPEAEPDISRIAEKTGALMHEALQMVDGIAIHLRVYDGTKAPRAFDDTSIPAEVYIDSPGSPISNQEAEAAMSAYIRNGYDGFKELMGRPPR